MAVAGMEEQRDQSRASRDDVDAELPSEVVAQGRGSQFRNRKAAGGNDNDGRGKVAGLATNDEFRGALDFADIAIEKNLDGSGAGFRFKEIGDVGSGAVAEELAEGLLVIGDAMLFNEGDEISRGEARESGFGKVRIGTEEIIWCAINIGEIAAASPGDEDFFAETVGSLEDSNTAAPLPCFDGAEKAGGAGTEYYGVEFARQ